MPWSLASYPRVYFSYRNSKERKKFLCMFSALFPTHKSLIIKSLSIGIRDPILSQMQIAFLIRVISSFLDDSIIEICMEAGIWSLLMNEILWTGRLPIQDSIISFYVEICGVCDSDSSLDVLLLPVCELFEKCKSKAVANLLLNVVRVRRDLLFPIWILRIALEGLKDKGGWDMFTIIEDWVCGREMAFKRICVHEEILELMFRLVFCGMLNLLD
jgi:hypothetical protein